MLSQFLRACGTDDFIEGIFHHADGQPGGDILHRGPILLGLFHRGIHKHGAPAAQVHGSIGQKAQLGKIGHRIAQGIGKGLKERAASRGTGFVEENVVNSAVSDLEALDVLAADVDDELHFGQKLFGGGEVGHGFHHAVIHQQGVLHDLLAVAGDGAGGDGKVGEVPIKFQQKLPHHLHRIAVVGLVEGAENGAVRGDDHAFDGGGTGVHTQVDRALISFGVAGRHLGLFVAQAESLIFLLAAEEGSDGIIVAGNAGRLQTVDDLVQVQRFPGGEGRAQSGIIEGIFRADAGEVQGFVKGRAQLTEEGEGTAQIDHFSFDRAALGQPGDGLVDHGEKDALGDVGFFGPLVEQGLDVGFGKDAAAGSDGIGLGGLFCHLVHLVRGQFHQGGHLVDESAGAAGTGAVHPHFGTAGEEEDLGVLASQFDDYIGAGQVGIGR